MRAATRRTPHPGSRWHFPQARTGPLVDFRFLPERPEDRTERIFVRLDDGRFVVRTWPVRARDRDHRPFFERDWPDFLTGAIFETAG
jgi:hypothetical protein